MINSAILLIIAATVFVLGYRFYAKFLAAGVFRLDRNYSPPPATTGQLPVAVNRHVLFGHHLAMLTAGTTLTGAAVALIWGWVPAFLWAVVASVIAAGTYGLGGLWLGFRHRGASPAGLAGQWLGSGARAAVLAVTFVVLLLLSALLALLAAQLLDLYPHVVLTFWAQIAIALALGLVLARGRGIEIAAGSVVALLAVVVGLWLFRKLPFTLGGAVTLELGGATLLTINNIAVWVVLVLALGFASARLPLARLARPYGFLTAVLLAIGLAIVFAAILWVQPPMQAPQFAAPQEAPGVLPWVFVTLVSGAIAGFHLLVAQGITAHHLATESDARYLGYGGALGEGLVAVAAVIACGAGFGGRDDWARAYADWGGLQNLSQVTAFVVERWVTLARGLGIDANAARAFFALLVLNLSVTTLDAGIRLQRNLLRELGETYRIERLKRGYRPLLLAVGLTALLALSDVSGEQPLSPANGFWPVFGLANHLLAALGLLLIGTLLARLQRPRALVIGPLLAVLALGLWALILQLKLWWAQQHWLLAMAAILAAAPALWVLAQGLLVMRRAPDTTPET
jgi:carbon starvation protein